MLVIGSTCSQCPRPAAGGASRPRGFTLIELMVVITIIGILATVGAPAFRNFILSQRVKTGAFDLVNSLTLSRSEAVKRNARVTMGAIDGNWNKGWTIAVGTTVIQSQDPHAGLNITDSAGSNEIIFRGDGRLVSDPTSFSVTTESSSDVTPRCVVISLGGQASSKQGGC